jgi:hypothetical protein
METLLVDRMALMLEDETAPHFGSVRASGSATRIRRAAEALRDRAAAGHGHVVALDDPMAVGGSPSRRSSSGATPASTTSCRASSKEGRSRCSALGRKDTGEPLNSEDMGCCPPSPARSHRPRERAALTGSST